MVSTVLDAWQRSGELDAGERAEALLTWLIDTYKRDGDESLQPNEFTFASGKKVIKQTVWYRNYIVRILDF